MLRRLTISNLSRAGRLLAGIERPIVLMYHRVASLPVDPWRLAVSPERFACQIELLTRERRVVPMHWLAKELREGRLPRRVAAVTFDDGYADVLENALPIIRRFNCPACVYITTDVLHSPHGFWWDMLSRIILEAVCLPQVLGIEIDGRFYQWELSDSGQQTGASGATRREEVHAALHGLLKPLGAEYRRSLLQRLAAWAGTDMRLRQSDRTLTAQELHRLAASHAIEIGAHTRTHPSLLVLNGDELSQEIGESRRDCEAIIGRGVTGFAYPFGDYNDASVRAVRETGLDYAVTTAGREMSARSDPFRIPRILVANWEETDFRREVLSHG
jgi:peptidoglycan/xylan/chitin deacetylase (PgdA/CDA1 family)